MKNDKKPKKKAPLFLIGFFVLLIACWAISWIPETQTISLDLIEGNAGHVRIALVTDLHSCYYGKDEKWLISRVDKQNPDLVILGGDIFDDKIPDQNAQIAVKRLAQKYPTYYVTGNHEFWSGRADEMKQYVESVGVPALAGDCESLTIGGVTLDICGVDDPDGTGLMAWDAQLQNAYVQTDDSHVKILASHRPEKTSYYEKYGFDLILTGHAHGGQFLIPFLKKGVFAPDQGLLATYVDGIYQLKNGSYMEVSRGLGRESTPAPRFFNRPQVVILELK
ncbi:MAG: metallophosphoesterase [Lachnospiraceae bacterium]|nr:metallophosphoesterase [Lachnospiraceae bacterium]